MTKYIIKNCEAIIDLTTINNVCSPLNCCCELVDDCLLKRIVEKCKETKEMFSNLPDGVAFDLTALLGSNLHEEILSMLEIEECEE